MTDPSTTHAPPEQSTIDLSLSYSRAGAQRILDDLVLVLGHSVSEETRDLFRQLRSAARRPEQEEVMPDITDIHESDTFFAPPQPVREAPTQPSRTGDIIRKVDVTGISGLGCIGQVCVFSDGSAVFRWFGGPPQDEPKFEFYDNKGIDPFLKISGHNGNTQIIWHDELDPQYNV
jgi:hypothetical protein